MAAIESITGNHCRQQLPESETLTRSRNCAVTPSNAWTFSSCSSSKGRSANKEAETYIIHQEKQKESRGPHVNEELDQTFDNQKEMSQHLNELPVDIIVDILIGIPDKHLAKFVLVSKHWYFMVSTLCLPKISPPSLRAKISGFIFLEFIHLITTCRIKFIADYDSKDVTFDPKMDDFMEYSSNFSPLERNANDFQDCCNGFLLLARSSVLPIQYVVSNPYTRECIPILVNPDHNHSESVLASLVFDPTSSLSFRVVLFVRGTSKATVTNPPVADIFWSETGTWSRHFVPLDPIVYGFTWNKRTVYFNGLLYRLSRSKFLVYVDLKAASAEQSTLKASVLELPERDKTDNYGVIGISGGYLCHSNSVGTRILFWVLDSDFKWVFKHALDKIELLWNPVVFPLLKCYYVNREWFKTYCFHPQRNEIILGTPFFLLSYNFETKHVEIIYRTENKDAKIDGNGHLIFPYARSHVILNRVLQKPQKCTTEL